jgi:hypothetical protein
MANTYKFDIVQVFTSDIETDGVSEQLVDKIEFSLIGYKENQNTFIIDEVIIPNVSKSIIPYSKLSKDDLLNWVNEFVDKDKVAEMKAFIDEKLDEMIAHFAEFENNNATNLSKPTLPPYASSEVSEYAVVIKPKIEIPS